MDAAIIETEKENIKPLVFGRSASKLGKALVEPRTPTATKQQRERFETDLLSEELDDPLQTYVDYISWIHHQFPQGASSESGLLRLLERCTSCFRDVSHYKNDPRYLRIWLEYAEYSDSPRDIFVYLAKKNIGQDLALYYEQFASYLEARGVAAEAGEVYKIGLERNAWPAKRLQRSFEHFSERTRKTITSDVRSAPDSLARDRPLASSVWKESGNSSKKQKLDVHHDIRPLSLKETVFSEDTSAQLNVTKSNGKENHIRARPWAGEILKQDNSVAEEGKPVKFKVYRDDVANSVPNFKLEHQSGQNYTIVSQPGKLRERLHVNMNLLYPSASPEICLHELRVISLITSIPKAVNSKNSAGHKESEQTFTIPLRDDDTLHRPRSPTITMVSRSTTNEVLGMFSNAAMNHASDDELAKEPEDSTNYEDYRTETMPVGSNSVETMGGQTVSTPPTDHYDTDEGSSPFLERP